MDSSRQEHARWLDRELREVPLPDGMLMRLRQIAAGGDNEQLDAQICNVTLPVGLLDRLRQIAKDDRLDQAVQLVEIPDGLVDRLQAAVAEEQQQDPLLRDPLLKETVLIDDRLTDEVLDQRLRDVAIPTGLLQRLGRAARLDRVVSRHRSMSTSQWVTAASLFLAVGLSYFGAMFALVYSAYQAGPARVAVGRIDVTVETEAADESSLQIVPQAAPSLAKAPLLPPVNVDPFPWEYQRSEPLPSAWDDAKRIYAQTHSGDLSLVIDDEQSGLFGFNSESKFDEIPPLMTVTRLRASGLRTPLVQGFDRSFFARRGVHPFVSPAASAELHVSDAPLISETDSFDLLWQRVTTPDHRSVLSTADIQIRPEEFLAAMNFEFDKPAPGTLALRTSAGPSPFAKRHSWILTDQDVRLALGADRLPPLDDIRMIHVGVQAGALPTAEHHQTHLTIAVDVSASMRWQGRLAMVRRAIVDLADRLHDMDRISLVTFSDQPQRLIEDVSRQNASDFRRVVRSLRVEHGTNFGAGLRAACAAALEGEGPRGVRRKLVILTDAPSNLDKPVRERIETMLATVHASGVDLRIVDLSRRMSANGQLESFADAAGGQITKANSASQIRGLLHTELTGRSQIIAHNARLQVEFNPKAVIGYRLIGHEASPGLLPGSSKVDLSAHQTATALFEIILRPNNENQVATAKLTWHDPANGTMREVRQNFHRRQFATSLTSSPVALQSAILAAETAEALRQSQSLRPIREAVYDADIDLQHQFEFRRLVKIIERLKHGTSGS